MATSASSSLSILWRSKKPLPIGRASNHESLRLALVRAQPRLRETLADARAEAAFFDHQQRAPIAQIGQRRSQMRRLVAGRQRQRIIAARARLRALLQQNNRRFGRGQIARQSRRRRTRERPHNHARAARGRGGDGGDDIRRRRRVVNIDRNIRAVALEGGEKSVAQRARRDADCAGFGNRQNQGDALFAARRRRRGGRGGLRRRRREALEFA